MKKITKITILILAFCYGMNLQAQSCANGTSFDLDENEFPQTCVTSNGAEGTPATATFDHDFATAAGGTYTSGTDGTNDVTVTMTTMCSFPNGTNGTTAVGACLGPSGLNVSQGAGLNSLGSGTSDFGGVTVNDAPCANCWVVVEYDFINGFTSTADGFDVDWSSLNGSTEGLEAAFGWVEGVTNAGVPIPAAINPAGLSGYCPAQALTLTPTEFLTGVAAGGALPAGVFGADAITGDGTATVCPTEEPGSSSGPNSTVSTGMTSGAIPANWGLNADDIITSFSIVYLMSNSNADDCDGDGATAVNTSPSGSLSTVDFCVPIDAPCPTVGPLADPGDICIGEDFDLAVTGLADMDMATNTDTDFGIDFVHYGAGNPVPANNYLGNSLGSVAFAALGGGGTTATIAGTGSALAPGTYQICAVLNPTPADSDCRPSSCIELVVNPLPAAPAIAALTVCEGDATEIVPPTGGGGGANEIFIETFEGAPSYTTSILEFSDGNEDFFTVTDGVTNVDENNFIVTGFNGTNFFAAQDIDGEGASVPQTISFTGIDITGLAGLQFKGLFAEDDDGGNQDWDPDDFLHIDYQIDGGGFLPLLWIEADIAVGFNGEPTVDTDFDGVGDGTAVTDVFQQLTAAIAGTGSTLDILITISLNSGDEDIAFDDIAVCGVVGAVSMYKYYDVDPALNPAAVPVAGPTSGSYDPGTTLATSPESIWVTACENGCEGLPTEVVITVNELPVVTAGPNVTTCGEDAASISVVSNMAGIWTGGIGVIANPTGLVTTYTPDPTEVGTTVTLTFTTTAAVAPCVNESVEVAITIFAEPDAEFTYPITEACQGDATIAPTHTTGVDGKYAATPTPGLTIDTQTGVIDPATSLPGTYTVTNTVSGCGNMIITGVIDATLAGGQPKAIELLVTADISDLSLYGIGVANNGGGTDGEEFSFPAGTACAGDYIYVAGSDAAFNMWFGFDPDYSDFIAISLNGDDAIELFCDGLVIDVFGDINVDGTGQPWDHVDGWAYRNADACPNLGVFDITEWTFSGTNVLDGEADNATAATPFPTGTATSTCTIGCPNDVVSAIITILPTPVINDAELAVCDDGDGTGTFILADAAADILGGATGLSLSFYTSLADAEAGSFAINTITYTGVNGEVLFVRAVSLDGCVTTAMLSLIVNPLPTINLQPVDFYSCGNPDDVATFTAGADEANVTFQWQVNSTGIWTNLPGENMATLNVTPVDATMNGWFYRVVVTLDNTPDPDCPLASEAAQLIVYTPTVMACNDNVQISLDANCEAILTADMILEGTFISEFYTVDVMDPSGNSIGNVLDGSFLDTPLMVTVYNDCEDLSCWSTVTVEDKLGPSITCPCEEDIVTDVIVDMFTGELTADSPTFNRPFGVGAGCGPSGVGTAVSYQVFEFMVDAPGNYNFEVSSFGGGDSFLALYEMSFDPTDPCGNMVTNDDDGGAGLLSLIVAPGMVGESYFLVMTTFGNGTLGTFEITLSNDAGGNVFTTGIGPDDACDFLCTDLAAYNAGTLDMPMATAADNCGDDEPVITFTDVVVSGGDCGTTVVTRTFVATDGSGNTATCSRDYIFEPVSIEDVTFPPNFDGIDNDAFTCADGAYDPDNTDGINALTGVPTINGGILYDGGPSAACGITATYTDQVLNICGEGAHGTYKILRTWTVAEWCQGVAPVQHLQIIKFVDDVDPVITAPNPTNTTVSTSSNDCTAAVILPTLSATDVCGSSTLTLTVGAPTYAGYDDGDDTTTDDVCATAVIAANGGSVSGLCPGTHSFLYTVDDGCGNTATYTSTVTVADEQAPVVVCDEHTVISITSDPVVYLNAISLDDGSFDACGDITFTALRMETTHCNGDVVTEAAESVPFYCCDAGTTTQVRVFVTDEAGLVGECMVDVEVQDKIDPVISCPGPANLTCTDDYTDLSLTGGDATGADNCAVVTITHTNTVDIDDCGNGTVVRLFTASDGSTSVSCLQEITIANDDVFFGQAIGWPADNLNLTGCPNANEPDFGLGPDVTGEPNLPGGADCSNIAVGYDDQVLTIVEGACIKIIRSWEVINWCEFDANDPDVLPGTQGGEDGNIDGYWYHNQTLKVATNDDPVAVSPFCGAELDEVCSDNCSDGSVELCMSGTDDCTASGDLIFEYEIASITTDASGNEVIGAFGPAMSATPDATGTACVNTTLAVGYYMVKWTVYDGCNNSSDPCGYRVRVKDCTLPTPVAFNGLAVSLDSDGNYTMWATELNSNSYDNCDPDVTDNTDGNNICDYLIVVNPTTTGDVNNPPSADNDAYTFTCADLAASANGFINVEFWVMDCSGNWNFVTTYILLEDNTNACGTSTAMIYGDISTELGDMVEIVTVNNDNMTTGTLPPGVPSFLITNSNGNYEFTPLNTGNDYEVAPEKDVMYTNGVSTIDIVFMSQHILGLNVMTSPYKLIAGDINDDGQLSTFDIVALRKLILGIDQTFPANTSWRFVDVNYVFPSTVDYPNGDPFVTAYPQTVYLPNLQADEEASFIGVKIGDLTGDANPNALVGATNRDFEGEFTFTVADQTLAAGEEVTVSFDAKEFAELLGYQFTLNFDQNALEVMEVAGAAQTDISAANFGLAFQNNGAITTSWDNADAQGLNANEAVFTVTFKATQEVTLSSALSIGSRYTAAEAYTKDAGLLDVNLEFTNNGTIAAAFDLYQNSPNPFKNETVVGFTLPSATTATLTIYDVSGKVLRLIEGDFAKGYNEISLNRSEIAGTGVLYYTLETATDSATKKMIVIE